MLWIAFKLYFYWVLWQLHDLSGTGLLRCELLSNCIFTGFFDNLKKTYKIEVIVVNCFQIVFLLGSLTTTQHNRLTKHVLWIAFKLYFYWVLWQLRSMRGFPLHCCELLSNCIFTGFFDNKVKKITFLSSVVNCFQIVFLLGSLTTPLRSRLPLPVLWIAFKLYFYWVLWQRRGIL